MFHSPCVLCASNQPYSLAADSKDGLGFGTLCHWAFIDHLIQSVLEFQLKRLQTLEIRVLSQRSQPQSSPTVFHPGTEPWPSEMFSKVRKQQSFCGESSEVMNATHASYFQLYSFTQCQYKSQNIHQLKSQFCQDQKLSLQQNSSEHSYEGSRLRFKSLFPVRGN